MYPDSPGSPDSRDCRRLLHGTTADDPFLTVSMYYYRYGSKIVFVINAIQGQGSFRFVIDPGTMWSWPFNLFNLIPGEGICITSRPRPSTLRLRPLRRNILHLKHRHGVQFAFLLRERAQGDNAAFWREFMIDASGSWAKCSQMRWVWARLAARFFFTKDFYNSCATTSTSWEGMRRKS